LGLESNRRLQILGERSVAVDALSRTRLLGSAPNPFNPATQVRFELSRAGAAVLEVFDARGRRIRTITAPGLGAGAHSVAWDGRDASGRSLPSGVYLYEIRSGAWRGRG